LTTREHTLTTYEKNSKKLDKRIEEFDNVREELDNAREVLYYEIQQYWDIHEYTIKYSSEKKSDIFELINRSYSDREYFYNEFYSARESYYKARGDFYTTLGSHEAIKFDKEKLENFENARQQNQRKLE